MEMEVIERIKYVCDKKKCSITALAKSIGLAQTTVNNYINGSRKVSFDFVAKVISTFELNSEWLLTGQGSMLKSESKISEPNIDYKEKYYGLLEEKDTLYKQKDALRDILDEAKDKIIQLQNVVIEHKERLDEIKNDIVEGVSAVRAALTKTGS